MNATNLQTVVKMVQQLLLAEGNAASITPAAIDERIAMVIGLHESWGQDLDRQAVVDELVRRFSLWVGDDAALISADGHVAWLNAGRKKNWRYWRRYEEWLETKLAPTAVEALDRSTDRILGQLEDPDRAGRWDRRGLVVGHVQSGKTGNYTGLICKAADAGYKIIIVLAGLHNNLRAQTQVRLDEGFLGYETSPNAENLVPVGVGIIDGDQTIRPNFATNRSEKGDFNSGVARSLGISPEQRPWLFVVKKNKTVLARLLQWIRNHVADYKDPKTGARVVTQLPLLLIDDEADHASVDTGEQVFDSAGVPDEEHQPTVINRLIRQLLHTFSRAGYVGYTATPFANIIIHERGETKEEGPDLFPSSFIMNLGTSSNYIGPAKVFGLGADEVDRTGMPLVDSIDDVSTVDGKSGWMPSKHINGHVPLHEGEDKLPTSLTNALDSFLLACTVRQIRGQGAQHASMLVHVTRYTSVQKEVHRQIENHVLHMRQRLTRRINHETIVQRLFTLWEEDFKPVSEFLRRSYPDLVPDDLPEWTEIRNTLGDVIADFEVMSLNGTSKDVLSYAEKQGIGLKVIAIGGDKLARGLTLEGLTTSYFLRASRMYDTLMQMGRWFGYRPGYLDVCRLYTSPDLITWFKHIADAAEELREEFEMMAASGATPREYGLKVQSHPTLLVTSRVKMRAAKDLLISFGGEILETTVLHAKKGPLTANLEAAQRFVEELGHWDESPIIRKRNDRKDQIWEGYVWNKVPSATVIGFLQRYRTHPEALKVRSQLLAEYIESMNEVGELKEWTVAFIGGGEGGKIELTGLAIERLQRKNDHVEDTTRYSIGRLISPRDATIVLDADAWDEAIEATRMAWKGDPNTKPTMPSGPAIRQTLQKRSDPSSGKAAPGLLLMYFLDPSYAGLGLGPDAPDIAAFAISFPGTSSGRKVPYKVNSVEWRQWEADYGPAD